MKSIMRLILAMPIIAIFCFVPSCSLGGDSLIIRQESWYPKEISRSRLMAFIPEELREYQVRGVKHEREEFRAYFLPIVDTLAFIKDTTNENPEFILALFDELGSSALVLLGQHGDDYTPIWSGKDLVGIGGMSLRDLNGDSINEIIVSLLSSTRGYINVFVFRWQKGEMKSLLPSGQMDGLSEFVGYVDIQPSDTGTTVIAYHPTEGVERVYFLGKGDSRFKLISEKKVGED